MTYIILSAGKGTRLYPLTLKQPKSLYKLDANTSVIQRMVNLIKQYDADAKVIIVTGFMADQLELELSDVIFVHNPFYAITNSIASLWFAREYLDREVTVINGDIVMESNLVKNIVCKKIARPVVLLDSSIKVDGDYNVQVRGEKVLVMSKNLTNFFGEYAGVTKLPMQSITSIKTEIERMVNLEMYDQWYENALVQLIFQHDFDLYYQDIAEYKWTEVDDVNDFLLAKKIHQVYT